MAAQHPEPIILPLDLSSANTQDYELVAGTIETEFGRLDGILHNAALFNSLTLLENQSLEQWLTLLRVNLAAPFALTRACMPLLKAAPEASVVMTSETHGHQPAAYWGSFAISKAGLEILVKIWSEELISHPQIRMNAIIPGPVRSPQRAKTHPAEGKDLLSEPEKLMPFYLYLFGKDSQDMKGQIVDLAQI
jgi:NAD(P)-dependent dehydrogenase (short-subunit alcohol dehydrogenase family)